jgi:hypothetical protein
VHASQLVWFKVVVAGVVDWLRLYGFEVALLEVYVPPASVHRVGLPVGVLFR